MRIEKNVLTNMERCYAVSCMDIDGEPYAFFATEGKGECCAFDCETLEKRVDVWQGPGGTMSIVEIPGKKGEFLAGQKFFRLFDWEEAEMVWVKPDGNGGFNVKTVLQIPYLHRFDILQQDGKNYFIGCSLASHKDTREDWSRPGAVYVAAIPDDWDQPFEVKVLRDDFYKNHGYERVDWNGRQAGMVTCEQGVFVVTPPADQSSDWTVEQIMEQPTSDVAVIDLDQDGEPEIATIEEFHGSYFRVYKKIDGQYRMIFEHPEVSEFYHVASSGKILGTPVFIGGCRRGKQQLFLLCWNKKTKSVDIITIDENVGPSNAIIANFEERDLIISANREVAQAVVYTITEK